MNLCTEFGHVEKEPAGSAVCDLQKINKELEKLQVSDDESVFSDSPGRAAFQLAEEQQVSQRQQGAYRDARSHSPAISLNSSAPSPSSHHRAKVRSPGGHAYRQGFTLTHSGQEEEIDEV